MPDRRHPVTELIRERAAGGSLPGAREDPHRVALVLEGGGMRGVVSAAMTAALERMQLTRCFDLVVGASAGAINGAALLAGAARQGAAAYCGPLASRSFVSPAKVLRGKPVIDVNRILDLAAGLDAAGHERVAGSGIALHCIAVDVEWAGGAPVEIGGRRYLDGGMGSAIPVEQAIAAGATHVLALQTRPHGVPRRSASRLGDRLIERHLRRLNPALVALYRDRVASYERVVDDIARRTLEPASAPYVLGIRPPAGTPCVSQLERRAPVLATAAAGAERLVEQALSAGAALRAA